MAARRVRLAAILVSGKKRTCEQFVGLPVQRIAEQPEHDVPRRARTAPELIPAAGLLLHPFDALHPGVEQDERSVNRSTSRKHIRKNDCIFKMCRRFIVFSIVDVAAPAVRVHLVSFNPVAAKGQFSVVLANLGSQA